MADQWTLYWLKEVASKVVKNKDRLPPDSEGIRNPNLHMQRFASEILRAMNDNSGNLFLDDGPENSGIGSFSRKMDTLLVLADALNSANEKFITVRDTIVERLKESKGNWGTLAMEHFEGNKALVVPLLEGTTDYDALVKLLEDLQFSTGLDLDKAENQKIKNPKMLELHAEFLRFTEGKDKMILRFADLIVRFVNGR